MTTATTATKVAKKNVQRCLDELKEMESFSSKSEKIGSPSLGDVIRQGDVYLTCIDCLPQGTKSQNRQLAEGDTQGSRHILSGDVRIIEGVKSFGSVSSALIGPAFECKGEVEVTHPEHGNKILPAGTCWQTTYQVAFAEEVRRVRD